MRLPRDPRLLVVALGGRALQAPTGRPVGRAAGREAWTRALERSLPPLVDVARAGFRVRSVHRQFVLPIALHKGIGSPRFTTASRVVFERLGLLRLFGSPVTLVAERCES